MTENPIDPNLAVQPSSKEQGPSTTMENPYLTELQQLQEEYRKQVKKMAEWKPPGFKHLKREFRRERNRRARTSRTFNRLRAKGK